MGVARAFVRGSGVAPECTCFVSKHQFTALIFAFPRRLWKGLLPRDWVGELNAREGGIWRHGGRWPTVRGHDAALITLHWFRGDVSLSPALRRHARVLPIRCTYHNGINIRNITMKDDRICSRIREWSSDARSSIYRRKTPGNRRS